MSDTSAGKAIGLCLRYLGIRPRSRKEMLDYIQVKDFSATIITQALEYLDAQGLVNDREFARQWTRMRLNQGKGDRLIQVELHRKGVSREIIHDTIAQIPQGELFDAMRKTLIRKKLTFDPVNYQSKQLIKKLLLQKGFSNNYIDAFLHYEVQ